MRKGPNIVLTQQKTEVYSPRDLESETPDIAVKGGRPMWKNQEFLESLC